MTVAAADKRLVRARMRALKAQLTDVRRAEAAEAVFSALERTALFQRADRILLYCSLPDELPTRDFLEKWAGRKQLFLPRVNGDMLELLPYDKARLRAGAYMIDEPEGDDIADVSSMHLVVVPAVAFDCRGTRLGRGKGFYDRLLAETNVATVGVGYDFQLVDCLLPAEPHDVALDVIITESRVIGGRLGGWSVH